MLTKLSLATGEKKEQTEISNIKKKKKKKKFKLNVGHGEVDKAAWECGSLTLSFSFSSNEPAAGQETNVTAERMAPPPWLAGISPQNRNITQSQDGKEEASGEAASAPATQPLLANL